MSLTITYETEILPAQENRFYKTFCQTYGNGLTEMEYELISHSINKEFQDIVFTISQQSFTNKTQILEEVYDVIFDKNKNPSNMVTTDNRKIKFLANFLKQFYNGDKETISKIQFLNKIITDERLDQIKPYIKYLFVDRSKSLESIFKRRYDFLKDLNFGRVKKEILSHGSFDTNENSKVNSSQSSDSGSLKQSLNNVNEAMLEVIERSDAVSKVSKKWVYYWMLMTKISNFYIGD